jgi:hypothetical protein
MRPGRGRASPSRFAPKPRTPAGRNRCYPPARNTLRGHGDTQPIPPFRARLRARSRDHFRARRLAGIGLADHGLALVERSGPEPVRAALCPAPRGRTGSAHVTQANEDRPLPGRPSGRRRSPGSRRHAAAFPAPRPPGPVRHRRDEVRARLARDLLPGDGAAVGANEPHRRPALRPADPLCRPHDPPQGTLRLRLPTEVSPTGARARAARASEDLGSAPAGADEHQVGVGPYRAASRASFTRRSANSLCSRRTAV